MRAAWLVATVLMVGCARGGQVTGATADVNGTWTGSWESVPKGSRGSMDLVLHQTGASVTGELRRTGDPGSTSGLVAGTVNGNEFLFREIGGTGNGVLAVKGTEMTGTGTFAFPTTIKLKRAR
jgi:hypothetical protein